jgi:hypothetical protein
VSAPGMGFTASRRVLLCTQTNMSLAVVSFG